MSLIAILFHFKHLLQLLNKAYFTRTRGNRKLLQTFLFPCLSPMLDCASPWIIADVFLYLQQLDFARLSVIIQ